MLIKQATANDIIPLAALMSMLHSEAALPLPPIDEEKLYNLLVETTANKRAFLALADGEAVGVGLIQESQHYFSSELLLIDKGFYVREKWRSRGVPKRLFQTMRDYAKMRKLPLYFNVMTGKDALKKARWFEIMGGRCVGGTFLV